MPATPELWRSIPQVNTTDSGTGGDDQFDPQVAVLSNGNIVVIWEDNSDGGPGAAGGIARPPGLLNSYSEPASPRPRTERRPSSQAAQSGCRLSVTSATSCGGV